MSLQKPESRYVDLQVNGYAGVDFNSDCLTLKEFESALQAMQQSGVELLLPTIITDSLDRMVMRIATLAKLRSESQLARSMVAGFHIEGPFINAASGFVGAHPAKEVRPANLTDILRLLEAADGLTKIVTLAPEADINCSVIKRLVDENVIVSAGHCDPSLVQLDKAIDAGLSMFTHLGNGCPLSLHRHDNVIQRVLSRSERLSIGLITDGIHLPWFLLKNILNLATVERCFVVSDAISAAGLGAGEFELANQRVIVDEHGGTWTADRLHLVGSATSLPTMANRMRSELGLSDIEISMLTYDNPKRLLTFNPLC